MTAVLPQLLRRTLSGKEACTRRRGSAPAPVAPSELRGLTTAVTHSANGARKKLNQVLTCPQWITKATYSLQEHTMHLPRRSSLPVEVLTGARSADAFILLLPQGAGHISDSGLI